MFSYINGTFSLIPSVRSSIEWPFSWIRWNQSPIKHSPIVLARVGYQLVESRHIGPNQLLNKKFNRYLCNFVPRERNLDSCDRNVETGRKIPRREGSIRLCCCDWKHKSERSVAFKLDRNNWEQLAEWKLPTGIFLPLRSNLWLLFTPGNSITPTESAIFPRGSRNEPTIFRMILVFLFSAKK